MYLPIKFMKQMDSYIKIPTAKYLESYVNRKSLEYAEQLGEETILNLYINRDYYTECEGSVFQERLKEIEPIIIDFQVSTNVAVQNLKDFLDQLLYSNIKNKWSKYKLAYRVDSELLNTLSKMEIPEFFSANVLSKIPASCFYIDFGEECPFCEDVKGFFVNMHVSSECINVALISLADSNRVIPITTVLQVKIDGVDLNDVKVKVNDSNASELLKLGLEDGKERYIKEKEYLKFFYNFMIYLQAANRDVEYCEPTKAVSSKKKGNKVKSKESRVEQYDVGFRYGRKIKANEPRVVYEKSNTPNEEKVTRLISSHYRSAHWHHYWKGSGENKELIIKWVEGVFVQGTKESEKITIHKVE